TAAQLAHKQGLSIGSAHESIRSLSGRRHRAAANAQDRRAKASGERKGFATCEEKAKRVGRSECPGRPPRAKVVWPLGTVAALALLLLLLLVEGFLQLPDRTRRLHEVIHDGSAGRAH